MLLDHSRHPLDRHYAAADRPAIPMVPALVAQVRALFGTPTSESARLLRVRSALHTECMRPPKSWTRWLTISRSLRTDVHATVPTHSRMRIRRSGPPLPSGIWTKRVPEPIPERRTPQCPRTLSPDRLQALEPRPEPRSMDGDYTAKWLTNTNTVDVPSSRVRNSMGSVPPFSFVASVVRVSS